MSAGNFQFERKRNYELKETIVASTHTVKTGTATYNGINENPIKIVDPAADFTLTVADGAYPGQTLLIYLSSNSDNKTVTVTATTGDSCTLDTAGDYISYEWIDSTTGWQEVHSEKAS